MPIHAGSLAFMFPALKFTVKVSLLLLMFRPQSLAPRSRGQRSEGCFLKQLAQVINKTRDEKDFKEVDQANYSSRARKEL